jgi:hypothetical protein
MGEKGEKSISNKAKAQEAGQRLAEEVRVFLLSGWPNLRSSMSVSSEVKRRWYIVKWHGIVSLHQIVLEIQVVGLSAMEFQNVKHNARFRVSELVCTPLLFEYTVALRFTSKSNKKIKGETK